MAEAIADREHALVILLNTIELAEDGPAALSKLKRIYPDAPIFLLHDFTTGDDSARLPELLKAGANDYVYLDEAGLLVLGRRLESLAQAGQTEKTTGPGLSKLIGELFGSESSQLAVQVIGADNRVRVWNRAAETFFGLKQEQAIGQGLEDLPLSRRDLSRLKDILDQARVSGEVFSIANYPFDEKERQPRWSRVYIYPLPNGGTDVGDICIVSADVTDLKQLAVETQYYSQELRILLEISRTISEQLDLPSTLEKIAEQTKSLFNAENCYIFLLEKDNRMLRPVLTIGPNAIQVQKMILTVGQGVIGNIAATGRAVMVHSDQAKAASLYGDQPDFVPVAEGHLLGAPLTALKGIIGLLVISKNRAPSFSEDDFHFFKSLVQQASWAVSNARLFEETQRHLNELAIFYEASATISTTWNTQEVLTTLVRQMGQGMDVSRGHIVSWDKDQNRGMVQETYSITSRPKPAMPCTIFGALRTRIFCTPRSAMICAPTP